jgi:hypothetical protein
MPRFVISPPKGQEWVRYCAECETKEFPAACDAAAACGKCVACSRQSADTEHHRCAGCAILNSECEACGKKLPSKFRPKDDLPDTLDELEKQASLEKVRALKFALLGKGDEATTSATRARRIGVKSIKLARAIVAARLDTVSTWISVELTHVGNALLKGVPKTTNEAAKALSQLKRILTHVRRAIDGAKVEQVIDTGGKKPRRARK